MPTKGMAEQERRGHAPSLPNFGRSIISITTRRQQIMPPICLLPSPSDYQTFRRPCDRPRFRSWGGQKPKQLNTSCSQYTTRIAGVKYPKYKWEKAEKKLVENWKKFPHSEHLLDDEKGTTEKNSTLLHCVSPVSSFVLSLWGIGKTPVVLCIISGLQFSNSGRSLYSWRGRFMRKV